jgi:hypothetical protein
MEALERRFDGAVRMPVDLLVQLSHETEGETYDADAVNLGAEGIGLRSAILPDVGQRLRCRFELPDDGGTCETEARVVWASDTGTQHGEFGVKFDTLEPRVQAIVDRWVSTIEGTPRVITPISTASPEPRRPVMRGKTAAIHLDGVGSPIEGMVTSEDGPRVSIAQPLPFLSLGKGATLEVGADSDRRALSNVSLIVENGIPRLVLTLEKIDRVVNARSTTKSAPPETRAPEMTMDEPFAPPRPSASPSASEWVTGEPETPSIDEPLPAREVAQVVRVSREEDAPADADATPSVSLKERVTPHLVTLVATMRTAWTLVVATAGPWTRRAIAWLAQAAKTAATYVREHAPEKVGALLGRAPRRRTTTPPAAATPGIRRARPVELPPEPKLRGKGRLVLAGVMALVAVGLTAYAFSSPASEPIAPAAPEVIEAAPEPVALMPEPVMAETPIETAAEIPLPPAVMPEPVPSGGHLPAPTYPSLGATPEPSVEAEAEAAPIASAPSSSFGADEVPNGRATTLRMSQPITSLVGQADESGFTVTVDGALSLDRAGPIAAANPSVERASILNRGDHCVLTVRFVSGRSPAYRVAIRGQAIEVTIGR